MSGPGKARPPEGSASAPHSGGAHRGEAPESGAPESRAPESEAPEDRPGLGIDSDLCSLSRFAASGCSACAAACPTEALTVGPAGLDFDPGLCTGCGACVARCPQGAVSLPPVLPLRAPAPDRQGSVLLVCPRHSGHGALCVAGLGLAALAGLWLAGVRRIALATSDCTSCDIGNDRAFRASLATLNALLADRGLAPLVAGRAGPDALRAPRLDRPAERPDAGRRSLFAALGAVSEAGAPLARLNRARGRGGVAAPRFAFSPVISPDRCTGCSACVRACPEPALLFVEGEDGRALYRADPAACTGCGLCLDLCDVRAVTVDSPAPAAPDVALAATRCRACGVAGWLPEGRSLPDGLCPVCAGGGRRHALREVLT